MNRIDVLTILAAPLIRERRPVRLSRLNAALTAAGMEETTAEEVGALVMEAPTYRGEAGRAITPPAEALA
ncbi:hypothetical protein ACJ41P_15785 [Azospirillum argentinense]|uniref:Uncharacterized protein n=1 Tax=Azospirillum argentinense TaxID=2970906 RepID=A0ABW8V8P3_9PROT